MGSTTAKQLTPRQQRVQDLLDEGKTTGEIAKTLKITTAGVNSHIRAIRRGRATAANDNGNGTQVTVGQVTNTVPRSAGNNGGPDIVAHIRKLVDEGRIRAENIDGERMTLAARLNELNDEYDHTRADITRHERALEVYES